MRLKIKQPLTLQLYINLKNREVSMDKRVAFYARHLGTREKEMTIEEQVGELMEYAKANNLKVVSIYCDYLHDKSFKPIAINNVIRDCKKDEFDMVAVQNTEVLGRDTKKNMQLINSLHRNDKDYIDISSSENEVFNKIGKCMSKKLN